MAGEFGGIGVLLGENDKGAYVVDVYKDTPAAKGGVKSGDIFSAIDGQTRAKWTTEEVVKRVRGKQGTEVELTMIRPNGKGGPHTKPYTVTLERDTIVVPNVESSMKRDKVGYIRVGQFNGNTTEEIAREVKSLEKKGARSLVLDLRDNPGGALDQAVKVSSLFIDDGVVVRVDERGKDEEVLRTQGSKVTDLPMVLLINGNSASASEIVGGALQDYGRAKLVGEKSFGKGSVQTVNELSFGGAVKYTIAHYLTPKKRVIDGKGLIPDVVVKMAPEKQADEKTDTQLQKALREAAAAQK
jgi:carboxyl-terminal processing protease